MPCARLLRRRLPRVLFLLLLHWLLLLLRLRLRRERRVFLLCLPLLLQPSRIGASLALCHPVACLHLLTTARHKLSGPT